MRSKGLAVIFVCAPAFAACTTVADTAPNTQELMCPPMQQEVCSGGYASRLSNRRDPFAVCRCESASDKHYEPLPRHF